MNTCMVSLSPTPLISCAATLLCGTNFSRSLVTFIWIYLFESLYATFVSSPPPFLFSFPSFPSSSSVTFFFALLDLLLFQQPSGCLFTSCHVRLSTVRAVLCCETSYLVAVLIDLSGCSRYRLVKSSWKL